MPAGLTLHFADDLVSATLNSKTLPLTTVSEGVSATLPALPAGEHQLTFETVATFPAKPYVWLKGPFTLQSRTPYTPGPNATIRTDGPFVASAKPADAAADLVAGGFPFLYQALVVETKIDLAEASSSLAFPDTIADALRVSIDGADAGWIWGPDWELSLDKPLAVGTHTLRLEVVPSSFNHYGPHHYYNGDWPVVSPGQILGDKNFADAPDAPDHTHVPQWHFKPLQLPASVVI